jgi:hypothetical protein
MKEQPMPDLDLIRNLDLIRKTFSLMANRGKSLALIGGLGIYCALHGIWSVSGDNAYTQREALQTVSGFVEEASEITVTGNSGRTMEKHYQINVTPEGGGGTLELRIRHGVPPDWVENLRQKKVTFLHDASENVYEAAIQGEAPQLTYEGTRDHYIATAKSTAKIVGSWWWWVIAVLMLALGLALWIFSSVLQRQLEEATKQDAPGANAAS